MIGSMSSAPMQVAGAATPPRESSVGGRPLLQVVEYSTEEVVMERTVDAAPAWFAEILARRKFGIAIAAMISMIATTIISSISEKPLPRGLLVFRPRLLSDVRIVKTRVSRDTSGQAKRERSQACSLRHSSYRTTTALL